MKGYDDENYDENKYNDSSMTMSMKIKLTTKKILNNADKTSIIKMMKIILKMELAETVMTETTKIII